jgi:hypothetical protein
VSHQLMARALTCTFWYGVSFSTERERGTTAPERQVLPEKGSSPKSPKLQESRGLPATEAAVPALLLAQPSSPCGRVTGLVPLMQGGACVLLGHWAVSDAVFSWEKLPELCWPGHSPFPLLGSRMPRVGVAPSVWMLNSRGYEIEQPVTCSSIRCKQRSIFAVGRVRLAGCDPAGRSLGRWGQHAPLVPPSGLSFPCVPWLSFLPFPFVVENEEMLWKSIASPQANI